MIFGAPQDFVNADLDLESAALYWSIYGDEITKDWINKHPCSRPWAFWKFDQGREKPMYGEARYLERLGLLTAGERKLRRKHRGRDRGNGRVTYED
jgi:hypothetical protein